jgi:hypothetical protein
MNAPEPGMVGPPFHVGYATRREAPKVAATRCAHLIAANLVP